MTTIATWNLHHMGREVKIPKGVLPVIEAERPDVLVLTEWVDRGRRADFLYGLQRVGYGHVHQSAAAKGQNQVLVASTVEQEDGAVQAPEVQVPDVDEAAQTNFLHRFLPSKRLHVVGFRVPHYQSEKPRRPEKLERYWRQVTRTALGLAKQKAVFIGDFNVGSTKADAPGQAAGFPLVARWIYGGRPVEGLRQGSGAHAADDGAGARVRLSAVGASECVATLSKKKPEIVVTEQARSWSRGDFELKTMGRVRPRPFSE